MQRQPRHRRYVGGLTAACLLLGLAGCGIKKPEFTELLWPQPPLTPRIKFVGLLRNQHDLGRPVGELIAESLVGRKASADSLARPMAVAPSRDGRRLYVSDYEQARVVVFHFETRRMETLGGEAFGFEKPVGVAVDANDNVYVVDSTARRVRVFDSRGRFLRNIAHPEFERPTGIAVDSNNGRIYVVDSARKESANHVVHVMDMDGAYLRAFGGQGVKEGKLFFPTYASVDHDGNVYVTDSLNSRVQVFDPGGRYLRSIGRAGDGFGMFHKPKGVALDSFGNLYVADAVWSNVQIFNPRGEVLLYFAGRGGIPGLLNNPAGLAIDGRNRIYVADAFNARIAIYELVNTEAADSFLVPGAASEKGGAATVSLGGGS